MPHRHGVRLESAPQAPAAAAESAASTKSATGTPVWLIAFLVAASLSLVGPPATDAGENETTSEITVVGAGLPELARLDEATARFDRNNLELPSLEVVFSANEADCKGHFGLFQRQFSPWRIMICSELDFVLTHELAHAWLASTLDDERQTEFVEFQGLEAWSGSDLEWDERGVEHAAFVMQQNLMTAKPAPQSRTWQQRIAGFELLTGLPSPRATATP